jgi:ABC-2 type transport system permease protein
MRIFPLNIFVRELRANLKSLVIWSVIMILLILVGTSKFSAFAGNVEMLAIVDSMPPAVVDALSMRAFNLTTLTGFFGIMFIYFGLLGGIAAAMWGSDIISKEERDKTVEFSLVLPVSRSRVITGKALAVLVNCIAFVLITWAISLLAVQSYNPDQEFYNLLALEMLAMFLIELIFLSVGLLLGCAMKQYKRASSVAVAVILITYFMSVISGMQENLDFLKYFIPYRYYSAGDFFRSGSLDGLYVGLTAVIVVLCILGAYLSYHRRDLYI